MSIKNRKKDHVDLAVSGSGDYIKKTTGFERFGFRHNALPEIDFHEISTETLFLGKRFSFPIFISSMTGGYAEAGLVNAIIAEFCEQHNIPFGVGSQRIMLENRKEEKSFSIVREKAPTAFIAANIGGAQLIGGISKEHLERLVGSIHADAIIVHLNPLQELMQPEGDRNFNGIRDGISRLVDDTHLPVMVKETGAGISAGVARRLLETGVSVIDVAGAGGTSWSKIENRRTSNKNPEADFDEWGIPTVEALIEVEKLKGEKEFELIVSGGVRSSFDLVKGLCLGADIAATAQPVIRNIIDGGMDALENWFNKLQYQTRVIFTLLGANTVEDLNSKMLIDRSSR